eukprot:scaffold34595_cov160-Amphora_coffeaeformis.AAC.15
MRIPRHERPWVACAIFLLFVLLTMYDKKNNPNSRVVANNKTQKEKISATKYDTSSVDKYGNNSPLPGQDYYDDDDDGGNDEQDGVDDDDDYRIGAPNDSINLDDLPDVPSTDFNFCTAPYVLMRDSNRTVDIPYQCDGPYYRSFISHLRAFSDDMVTQGEQSFDWGHRTTLPANRKYLFLGNSHTRQTAMALLCQLNVRNTESLEQKNLAMARRYDLDNGAQVYLVVNSYVVHSPKWVGLLEKQVGVNLTDFDAVVLGLFNTCNSDVNTTFTKEMKEMTDEDAGVDCMNQEGPSLKNVAAVYPGPLLYVSMFATYRYYTYSQDKEDASKLRSRSNLLYLDGRQYIRMDGMEECGSPKRDELSDCANDEDARRHQHRCVGKFGGHPDLIAWDVVEFLYRHVSAAES